MFPQWINPYVAETVPYVWLVKWHLYSAKAVLEPLIARRRKAQATGTFIRDSKYDNLLQFMDEAATGIDGRPDKLKNADLDTSFISYYFNGSISGPLPNVRKPRVHTRVERGSKKRGR